jgi:serine/threonine protein kinase
MARLFDLERNDIEHERVKLVGKGGCGEVWLARENGTGRQVALKILMQMSQANDQKSFIREITIPVRLNIPYVVPLFGFRLPGVAVVNDHGVLQPERSALIITR